VKKGRHRRFEEARALKRSHEVDLEDLFEDITDEPGGEHKPEHDAWADLAEEWETSQTSDADSANDADAASDDTVSDDAVSDTEVGDDIDASEAAEAVSDDATE